MEGETDTAFTGKPLQANIVILMTPYTGFPTPGSQGARHFFESQRCR